MVPPYGSGATLYLRPYMYASSPVIGVKPAEEYQFRLFATPVGPYFHEGAKQLQSVSVISTVLLLRVQAISKPA